MKDNEIYRSFTGKIDTTNRWGYIVYDKGDYYGIKEVSAYLGKGSAYRIPKSKCKDYTDFNCIVDAIPYKVDF